MSDRSKRTALYDEHEKLGAKFIEFAGWELPLRYKGIIEEHHAVRQQAGIFDICHMGEIFVGGPEAESALQYLTCNDVSRLEVGRAQYSALLNLQGGVVDDIIVYRIAERRYLMCVNAANTEKDLAWLKAHNRFDAEFSDQSARFGLIALQGPLAAEIVRRYCDERGIKKVLSMLPYFRCCEVELEGVSAFAARTGYTGEDGFEFFLSNEGVSALWRVLLEVGSPLGLSPAGLGARDTLRLEACYPLHGHELREDVSALESGLGWIVKFDKGDFVGREALWLQWERGLPRRLIGFFVEEQGIVREGSTVFDAQGCLLYTSPSPRDS